MAEEINEIREGVWRVSGSLHVEELADALDITLPEDLDYDTVAGMILSCLPTVPEDGSTVTVEIFGLRVQVESVRNRKICWALVEKIPQEEKPEEEEKRSAE